MTRWRIVLVALWALAWLVWALVQIGVVEAQDKVERVIVVRGVQMPASLVLVVDRSGSMVGPKYIRACYEAKRIAEQAGDGARVKFVAFAQDVEFYESGAWIELPNAEELFIADAWMRTRAVYGLTHAVGAMASVLEKDKDQAIGVVLITDAHPTDADSVEVAASTIVGLNAARKVPAVIGVLSVDADAQDDDFGLIVAKGAGGAYVRTRARQK